MSSMKLFLYFVGIVTSCTTCEGKLKSDKNVINICMDGKHHEHTPISTKLYSLCQTWESNSCCSNETAYHTQQPFSLLYNWNMSHCGEMSDKCLRRFYLSSCFYECSPNVGPWLRRVKSSIRNEKFVNIPICKSDCDGWWEDCKGDFTCVDSFAHFDWKTGTNRCPVNSTCQSFAKWFHNATNFCETIYIGDYKVAPENSSMCMRLDFQGHDNPNDKVSRAYAKKHNLWNGVEHIKTAVEVTTHAGGSDTVKPYLTPTEKPLLQQTGTIVTVCFILLLLAAVVVGVLLWKCKHRSSSQEPCSMPGLSWFKKSRTQHSVIHNPVHTDHRPFLQADDEDDDRDLNPHGTLEIDL